MTNRTTYRSRLQRLAGFIDRIASLPVLLTLVLLSVLFPVVVFPVHGIAGVRPPDLYFSCSPDQIYEYLAVLGAEGRRAYIRMALTSDLAFPLVYSAALSMALMLLLRKWLPPARRHLGLFPFLIVIADWAENLGLVMVARAFPGRADAVAGLASTFTTLKWVLIVLTVLMLLAVVAFGAARVMRAR